MEVALPTYPSPGMIRQGQKEDVSALQETERLNTGTRMIRLQIPQEGVRNHQDGSAHHTPKSSAATQNSEEAWKIQDHGIYDCVHVSAEKVTDYFFLVQWDMMAIHEHGTIVSSF